MVCQWMLDLLFSRQIEQFLTLKDLEQIEQLAAQVRATRSESSRPMNPTTEGAAQDGNPASRGINSRMFVQEA